MSKRRTPLQATSEYNLGDGHVLTFITTRDNTVCVCETLLYDKLVARHPGTKDLQGMHDSLRYLFQQYVDDAKKILTT